MKVRKRGPRILRLFPFRMEIGPESDLTPQLVIQIIDVWTLQYYHTQKEIVIS
jgi:hypothetical protein